MRITQCRICYDLTLEQRADVEARALRGEPYAGIERDYPGITRFVVYKHLKHAGNPEREEKVAVDRLCKEVLIDRIDNFDYKNLTIELRDRLSCVLLQSQELIDEYMDDVQQEVRSPDDLNAVITAQRNLLANLDTISGIKKLISIDAAMGLLYAEGYKISSGDEKK